MSAATPTSPSPRAVPPITVDRPRLTPALTVCTGRGTLAGDPVATLVVTGELDIEGAPLLRSVWDTGLPCFPARVLMDLRGVEFCNAAGLRVLAHITATSRDHGLELTILPSPRLDWLLHLIGLGQGLPPHRAAAAPRPRGIQAA